MTLTPPSTSPCPRSRSKWTTLCLHPARNPTTTGLPVPDDARLLSSSTHPSPATHSPSSPSPTYERNLATPGMPPFTNMLIRDLILCLCPLGLNDHAATLCFLLPTRCIPSPASGPGGAVILWP